MFDKEEFERWIAQASDTLNSARQDYSTKSYNWCCFKAQQAAEYAVKGLLKGLGFSAYGHSIVKLLRDLETYSLSIQALTSWLEHWTGTMCRRAILMHLPKAALLSFMMIKPHLKH